MSQFTLSRRKLIEGSLVASAGLFSLQSQVTQAAQAPLGETMSDVPPREPDFRYEVQFTDSQWREKLSDHEYQILRKAETEEPKSSPLWKEAAAGDYRCKGCSLLVYASENKVVLDKGWVFFTHSETDSVLNGIDQSTEYDSKVFKNLTEAHCRRCGSHLGHILYINKTILNCINGASLVFETSTDKSRRRSKVASVKTAR
ncbi:MAG: peptide-methionine (R)-S-oxide reductase [Neolewinella sp.]|jgi:peptide-methionine (R)-S-oxide reductase